MIYFVRVFNTKGLSPTRLLQVGKLLEKALEHNHGEVTLGDIYGLTEAGKMQLWVAHDGQNIFGAAVTEIIDYSQISIVRISLLAGDDFDSWIRSAYATFCEFAKEHQCTRLEAVGRRGWVKRLASLGFEEAYTTVIKEVK